MRGQSRTESSPGTDAAPDLRRILLYAVGLVAIYLVGVAAITVTHIPTGKLDKGQHDPGDTVLVGPVDTPDAISATT